MKPIIIVLDLAQKMRYVLRDKKIKLTRNVLFKEEKFITNMNDDIYIIIDIDENYVIFQEGL